MMSLRILLWLLKDAETGKGGMGTLEKSQLRVRLLLSHMNNFSWISVTAQEG